MQEICKEVTGGEVVEKDNTYFMSAFSMFPSKGEITRKIEKTKYKSNLTLSFDVETTKCLAPGLDPDGKINDRFKAGERMYSNVICTFPFESTCRRMTGNFTLKFSVEDEENIPTEIMKRIGEAFVELSHKKIID